MTNALKSIKVVAGALDESDLRGGTIVLRGVVDRESLKHLKIDTYQREALPITSLAGLMAAIRQGDTLPDIEIGMRGKRCSSRSDDYFLNDDVFIIDGQQRVNAALNVLATSPDTNIRIGATIHFDTTRDWETERFRILNSLRAKVSPNVLLRNLKEKNAGIASLYGLSTNDRSFVLHDRVSWSQSMKRSDLISALLLLKVTARLHSHKSAGRSNSIAEMTRGQENLGKTTGHGNVRTNLKTYFGMVDECWGIKLVQYRNMAAHLRGTFLSSLASVISDHTDFWQDEESKKLFINIDLRRKIKSFPLHDPSVASLTSAGGKAGSYLYQLIVDHLNRGKRTGQLRLRASRSICEDEPEIDDQAAA